MAERGDVHDVVIDRVDDDSPDVPRLGESHQLPGVAAIGRLVHARAPRRALPVVVLSGPDPDEIRVVWRYRHVADGDDVVLIIEEDLPGRAVVRRFPEATGRGRDVEDGGIALEDGEIVNPARHRGGTYVPELQPRKERRWRPWIRLRW